ncbi:hypothetical protein ZWY2020_057721 [Hordeum vulgare]|nr:hypothetical protein ZWY2020_057721 [Hordeum vulgare]
MILTIAILNLTFIVLNFWNSVMASPLQLFLQSPPRTIEYVSMHTLTPDSTISLNFSFAATVSPARNNPSSMTL